MNVKALYIDYLLPAYTDIDQNLDEYMIINTILIKILMLNT